MGIPDVIGHGKLILGEFVSVEGGVLFDLSDNFSAVLEIGTRSKVKHGATIRLYGGSVRVGSRVSIGENVVIAGHGGVHIGHCTIIGPNCTITASEHLFASTDCAIRFQGETMRGIHIGTGVWIGSGVSILDGVHIGDHSIIGAGSVVTRDIAESCICLGVPCRQVGRIERMRLSDFQVLEEKEKNGENRKSNMSS